MKSSGRNAEFLHQEISSDIRKWQESTASTDVKITPNDADCPEINKPYIATPIPEIALLSNFPDINALTNNIIALQLEKKCKRNVVQKLEELYQRQAKGQQQIQQHQQKLERDRQELLAEKRNENELILIRADQLADEEFQEYQKHIENMRRRTEQHLQQITFSGILKYQSKFRTKYEAIIKLLASNHNDAQQACSEYHHKLREPIQTFEQLIGKIEIGDYGPKELKTAEKVYQILEQIEHNIIKDMKQFAHRVQQQRLDEENKAREEQFKAAVVAQKEAKHRQLQLKEQKEYEEQLRKQEEQHKEQVQSLNSINTASITPSCTNDIDQITIDVTNYIDPNRLAFYNQIIELYQVKVERVKPLQNDDLWKQYRTNCQKAINIPLNTISSVSSQHLADKFQKLYNFISGQPHNTNDSQITVNDHPLARDYCILLMAKKFVSQAETAISSNPLAAFPIASVIVSLWKLIPDFGQTLLAYIFKESPFLVPYFIQQNPGQSNLEYCKLIGYRVFNNNQLEQRDMYLKRQTGIARLYAAIMITPGRGADGGPHPYGIAEAWKLLTHMISLTPLPDLCATIIMEILQIVGSDLWFSYGKQFLKLLIYIQKHYFPRLNTIDEGGPKTRLELLLGKFLRDGQIPKPSGALPTNFW